MNRKRALLFGFQNTSLLHDGLFFSSFIGELYNIRAARTGKERDTAFLFCDCESERRAAVCRPLKNSQRRNTAVHCICVHLYENTHTHTVVALEATAGVGRSPFVLLGWFPSYSAFAYIFPVRLSVQGDTYTPRPAYQNEKREGSLPLHPLASPLDGWPRIFSRL